MGGLNRSLMQIPQRTSIICPESPNPFHASHPMRCNLLRIYTCCTYVHACRPSTKIIYFWFWGVDFLGARETHLARLFFLKKLYKGGPEQLHVTSDMELASSSKTLCAQQLCEVCCSYETLFKRPNCKKSRVKPNATGKVLKGAHHPRTLCDPPVSLHFCKHAGSYEGIVTAEATVFKGNVSPHFSWRETASYPEIGG